MPRNVTLRFTANVRSLQAGMLAAAASVKNFEGQVLQVAKTSNETQRIAGRAMIGIGAAVGAGLALATRSAIQFEQRMRNVSTISSSVRDSFKDASDAVLDLSGTLGVSANELAEGLYDVASAGFQGAEGMAVLKASAIAAQAGMSTTATAVRAITGALNAYGLTASDVTDISDIFFQTVNLGIVTFDELAQNTGDFMGTAAALGVALDDASAAFATITLAGVPAAEAATSLNGVMRALIKPSDELQGVIGALGYESGVAMVRALGLGGAMSKLQEITGGSVESFASLFPEIRATRGALALTANEGQTYARVAGQVTDENARAGAAAKALAEQQKSLGAQMKIAKEQVTAMAIGFGQALLPVLRPVVSGIQDVAAGFRGMSDGAQQATAIIGTVLAGLAGLGGGFLTLAPKISSAVKRFQELKVSAPGVATAIKGVGIATGILGAALAIGGIALSAYAQHKGEVKQRVDDLKASLDAETGAVSKNTDAVIANRILSEGLDEAAAAIGISIETVTQAMLGNKGAQDQIAAAYRDAQANMQVTQDASMDISVSYDEQTVAATKLFHATQSGAKDVRDATKAWQVDKDVKTGVAKATASTTQANEDAVQAAQDAAEAQKQLTTEFERAINTASVYTSTLSSMQEADRDAASSAKDAMEDRQKAERDALENEKITGSASQAVHDRKMDELEARQEAEKKAADVTDLTTKRTRLSMEEYRKGIEENTKRIRAWMRNLEVVGARGGDALKSQLAALGPEAAGLVEEVATSSDKNFGKFKDTMADSSDAAITALKAKFDTVPTILGEIGKLGGKALSDNILEQFRTGAVGIEGIVRTLQNLQNEMLQVPGEAPGTFRSRTGGATATFAEGHVAHIATSLRTFGEPETGGEAYIPLAYSKRRRSTALWHEVGRRFGLVSFDQGGMWAVPGSARVGGAVDPELIRTLGRLEQRLARGGGQIGQVVFNEKIDPLHAAAKIAWKIGSR